MLTAGYQAGQRACFDNISEAWEKNVLYRKVGQPRVNWRNVDIVWAQCFVGNQRFWQFNQ